MQIDAIERAAVETFLPASMPNLVDPLDFDSADDEVVVTTKRALIRLALVAADTASRFEREGIGHDPVAWMLAPRALFEGRAAVDACLAREECLRAVLLHGLSIGLDADPSELDALLDENADDTCDRNLLSEQRPHSWNSSDVEESEDGAIRTFEPIVARGRA
jgi:hypothetical protein